MAEMEIITINIDGRSIPVKKDSTILEAARENNIYIPALCNSELVEPYAACRLCIVEVDDGKKTKLVTSCNYPVRKPIKVFTSSDNAKKQINHPGDDALQVAQCTNHQRSCETCPD